MLVSTNLGDKMNSFRIGNFTIQVPIIQGGMGVGVSLHGLAIAVANQGGVGVISSAGLGLLYRGFSTDYEFACIHGLKEEIAKARAKTKGILGVNIMCAMTNFADTVKTAIQEKIDIIFSGAGLPMDLPSFVDEDNHTRLVPIVSSGRAAKIICEKWTSHYDYLPDAIVVEGPKAGGHLGFKPNQIFDENFKLETLVEDVCKAIEPYEKKYDRKIPVIAGGGIYTGEDAFNIMQHGASAVQMGTRFVTTEECDAAQEFKETYINATQENIEIIISPVGMPGRAIKNSFIEKVREGKKQPLNCPFHCIKTCEIETSPYCIFMALYNAYNGKMEGGFAFAGSNAYRAEKIETVGSVFADLQAGYETAEERAKSVSK